MPLIISWNVNGIRSVLKKGFLKVIEEYSPDIFCLQETRALPHEVELKLPEYHNFWNAADKPGYSGTAIFSRVKPLEVELGMGISEHDREGRVTTAEFKDFFLVNVYVPNSKRDLSRLAYRQKWDLDFYKFLKKLEKKKPVVFCGDMNVAHQEIDLTYPKANRRNHGFTDEERAGFDRFIAEGKFIDTFRFFKGDESGHYSWWSQMGRCRERNIGWRIDYFCVSAVLKPRLVRAAILPSVLGSDHCPVLVELK